MSTQPEALRLADWCDGFHIGSGYWEARESADELRRQHAEIEALQAKIDSLMLEYCPNDMSTDQMRAWELAQRERQGRQANVCSELIRQHAEIEALHRDAERYRWLRDGNDTKGGPAMWIAQNRYGMEWDAAIDAAMAAKP